MQFSENWLKALTQIDIDTDSLSHKLTMAGLEVDQITPAAAQFSNVCVGFVESKEEHPDADKLNVCIVDLGGEKTQIVCGAKNVAAGQKVPVAKVGAVLPGDFKIKQAKLRGVESNGMICSESELGLAESAEGIMVLPEDAPVGEDFRSYLELDDNIIEIDLTANRGDCLSLSGVAREVAVACDEKFSRVEVQNVMASTDNVMPVNVKQPEACPLYVSRVISGIKAAVSTPLWMVERLRRSGIRSIHPVVDVTSYVMILLGQPMHAFDHNKLKSEILVDFAKGTEVLTLLDEAEVKCQEGALLILDQSGPIALAGIMGGLGSSVTENTTDIVLEAAHFTPDVIRGKARKYGLHTDSSHRFERGVDATLPVRAIELATALIQSICGGDAGPVQETGHIADASKTVSVRFDRVRKVLGCGCGSDEITAILERLGFVVESASDVELSVKVPEYRFDIAIEEDLIEEVARIYGLDNIKAELPVSQLVSMGISEKTNHIEAIFQEIAARGYMQAINYSFIDPKFQKTFYPDVDTPVLQNPISKDMSQMRGSLLPGLLLSAKHNLNRQVPRVHLFEQGTVFAKDTEVQKIAFLKCGLKDQEHFSGTAAADYYDLKGDLEALFGFCGLTVQFAPEKEIPFMHPGKTAKITLGEKTIGFVGAVHPVAQKACGLKQVAYVAEIDFQAMLDKSVPAFEAISKYPSIRRDLALVVDEALPASDLMNEAKNSLGDLLVKANVFDVYSGEGIDSRKKSLALSLILQDLSHTLIEEEVNSAIDKLLEGLSQKFDAKLRE